MNANTIALLASAVFSLLVGFVLLSKSMKEGGKNFGILNPMSWLLIGLFPVFLIFAFFPTTSVSGTVLGVSIGGAGALFLVIWKYGTKWTKDAHESKLHAELETTSARIAALEAELKEAKLRIAEKTPGDNPILPRAKYVYPLKHKKGKSFGIVTGDIGNVDFADVWVSSENTNMEMARHYDKGVSATIRFLGAKRGGEGVIEDSVADELNTLLIAEGYKVERRAKTNEPGSVEIKSKTPNVLPGTVLVTGSGELFKSNKVKKIFHVAAVRGDPTGDGYRQVPGIKTCVSNALEEVKKLADPTYKTILFPLLGTGVAGADVKVTARSLFLEAITCLEDKQDFSIETVYFIAWKEVDLQTYQAILAEPKFAERLGPFKKS